MAIAERIVGLHFPGVVDHRVWVLASDGDLMEGVSHEAASLAGHLGLERLVVLYDDNGISIDGPTDVTMSDDALGRFAAYGWDVRRCDGNSMEAVDEAIRGALAVHGRPHLIACRTTIGLRSPWAGTAKVHGSPLGADGLAKTKAAYGRAPDLFFHVPDAVRARYAEAAQRGAAEEKLWREAFDKFAQEKPADAAVLKLVMAGELPAGWQAAAATSFAAGTAPMATRQASHKTIEALYRALPSPLLVGGSADLTPSNLTRAGTAVDVARGKLGGNYLHYGIREHAMGSLMNGIATYGLRPFGATFLVFSDYMRPAIRMAAMMHLPVIFAFTHDSIGHGEDGPTHQPVEHLLSLRAIPGVVLIRAADANEAAAAWRVALERRDGPTILVFTRQEVPLVTPPGAPGLERGAYVLGEDPAGKLPDVALLATGSEVAVAVEAQKLLAADGVRARVVSMPSFEIFASQPEEYRAAVIPAGVPRVGVEAARTLYTWSQFGCAEAVGLDHYGASGSHKILFETFGITPKAVAAAAKKCLAKK
jgi:transketolase